MCCTAKAKPDRTSRPDGSPLTAGALWLGVLGPGGSWLGDPVAVVLLLAAERRRRWRRWWRRRRLRLVGERNDGGGGVGGGGGVLGVGEAVQVLAGGVDGAVDWTLCGAADAVLLRLVQVVGDAGLCTDTKDQAFCLLAF